MRSFFAMPILFPNRKFRYVQCSGFAMYNLSDDRSAMGKVYHGLADVTSPGYGLTASRLKLIPNWIGPMGQGQMGMIYSPYLDTEHRLDTDIFTTGWSKSSDSLH